MAGHEITDETRDRVVELYRQGTPIAEITEQTGVKRPSIYYILRQRGLRPTRTARHAKDMLEPVEMLRIIAECERTIGRLQGALRALGAEGRTDLGLLEGDLD